MTAPAPIERLAVIGCGLIGSSILRAARAALPGIRLSAFDADAAVAARAGELALADVVARSAAQAVGDADLVILCVPVGQIGAAARAIAPHLPPGAIVSDVGSVKRQALVDMAEALPGVSIVPAHPVAGTERSGPDAGFAQLFANRWCILTPPPTATSDAIARVAAFWTALGANVEQMEAEHHDLVLAVTSHVPHLIAYTIVSTASDLEGVTNSEVIKYSAGGFRDFTRIAASNPTMWRDVFLTNRGAVLEILQRFTEDLVALQRAIRWGEGDKLFDTFTRSREVRRAIIDAGQDTAQPDFGRK